MTREKVVVIESTASPSGWMKRMAHVFEIASTLKVSVSFITTKEMERQDICLSPGEQAQNIIDTVYLLNENRSFVISQISHGYYIKSIII